LQEWIKRNSLHQEKHPEVKKLLDTRQNKKYIQRSKGDQDGEPSHGLANGFGGLPLQCAQAVPGNWQTTTAT
jgi:hypothetical protein